MTLTFSGCIAEILGALTPKDLSPEQIDAYKASGQDVYGCVQAGGPPPGGNTMWIVVPHGTPLDVKFKYNCQLQ